MKAWFAKHWFLIALISGVAASLAFPSSLRAATERLEPRLIVALSLFLVAWTMPAESLLEEMRRPLASAWAVFLSYGLVPFSSSLLGRLAPDADVGIGLILVSAVPCTFSSAVLWTRMAGGNEATALLGVLGTTFTSWFMTTGLLAYLTGTVVELDIPAVMRDLTLSLILPTLAGQALQRVPSCARFADRHKVSLSAVSQCCVLAIVMKAGVTVGEHLHDSSAAVAPRVFAYSIVLAVVLHLFALGSALATSWQLGFDRGRQIAIAFASSQKTLPISLVLYEQYFKEEFPFAVMPLMFFHLGQLLLDTMIAQWLRQR